MAGIIPYILKTFRGGISDENDKGIAGSFKYGYGLDIHKRNDSLSCGSTMATILGESVGVFGSSSPGTTMTGIFNVFVPASDGSLYAFSATGSIFAMSGDGQWTFVYNDPGGNITGAAEWETNDGLNYLFWATASAIAQKPLPGSNVAPDTGTARWTDVTAEYKVEFISSTAVWHTMKPADGSLYIANNESIASVDYAGAFKPQAVNIRPGNMVNALEERNDYLIIGSEREDFNEEGHLWSWVSAAVNWVQKKRIPVSGVNALIYGELPLLQGGDNGEIFFSDFTNTVPVCAIPGGGRCNPEGVAIENDLAIFGIYGGTTVASGLWSYGRRHKNRPFALNYNYRLSPTINGSTISTIGAVINFNGLLIASWGTQDSHTSGTTSEYGVDMVVSTTSASAVYEGLEFDAGQPFASKYVDTVKITSLPLPASTSYSVKFKTNKESDWRYAAIPGGAGSTTYTQTDSVQSEWGVGTPGLIYEVGVELNPTSGSTPEILSITSYLDSQRYLHG